MPINRSSRTRLPTNQLMTAPASGAKMIRLRMLVSIRKKIRVNPWLQLQNARIIHIQRLSITKDRNNDPQTDRSFSSSDCHYDEHKKLPGNVLKKTCEGDKREVHSVQHQLDAHEHCNDVSLDDHARDADREQHRRQRQVP